MKTEFKGTKGKREGFKHLVFEEAELECIKKLIEIVMINKVKNL